MTPTGDQDYTIAEKQAAAFTTTTPARYQMCLCSHIRGQHRDEGFQGCTQCACVSFCMDDGHVHACDLCGGSRVIGFDATALELPPGALRVNAPCPQCSSAPQSQRVVALPRPIYHGDHIEYVCDCGAPHILVYMGGQTSPCKGCGRVWAVRTQIVMVSGPADTQEGDG